MDEWDTLFVTYQMHTVRTSLEAIDQANEYFRIKLRFVMAWVCRLDIYIYIVCI